jgi:L-ascorbate metabolism protein UlaG (beta-lactamase superfamily)
MKITRYFQSCLLIEEGAARMLIDPSGQEATRLNEFGKLDAVLYTHEHGDHFDGDLAQQLSANGAKLYANASTAKQMKSPPEVVSGGQEFEVGGIKVKAIELPHCLMWDGSAGPQNTGYLIAGKLFHSGDGANLDGLSADVVALPITGPDVSLKDAFDFVKQLSAKTIIPVHYDYIGTKPEVFAELARGQFGVDSKVLAIGQSTQV